MKFRKKPVVIEAERCLDLIGWSTNNWYALPKWFRDAYDGNNVGILICSDHILINTLEGEMRADIGDWIIRGVKGEIYPCKPDIFDATYEPAP